MAPLPPTVVEVGFGSTWKTAEASITWTDISLWVIWKDGVSWGRGRSSRFGTFQPGTASFKLRNNTRRFDPENAASPYVGQLLPNVPVRIRSGSTVLWRGFVDDWPMAVDGALWAEAQVSCTDGLGILARSSLPSSWYALAVRSDGPEAWWRMAAQRDVDEMVDSSGNRHDGSLLNATLGLDSLVNDPSDKAVGIAHGADARGEYYDATYTLPNTPPYTVEALIQVVRASEDKYLWCLQRDATGIGWAAVISYPTGSPNGELRIRFSGLEVRGTAQLDDGLVHHVAVVVASTSSVVLYVDGVADPLSTVTGATPFSPNSNDRVWTVGNVTRFSVGDFGLGGTIDEVAIYDRALSAGEAFNHAASAFLGGSSDGAFRLGEILDFLGWPAGQRDIHTFDTVFGTGDFDLGGKALEYMQRVDKSEQGRLFVNAAGKLVQLPRYWFLNVQTTPSLTLSDDSDPTAARYSAPKFSAPKALLKNLVSGSRAGSDQKLEARDQASIDTYGEFPESFDGLFAVSDGAVRSILEWVVARYKDPKLRLQSITVDLFEQTTANRNALLALDCDQRVIVENTPASTGAQSVFDVSVDGLRHRRTADRWTIDLELSSIDTDTAFGRWGTGLWGTALWA